MRRAVGAAWLTTLAVACASSDGAAPDAAPGDGDGDGGAPDAELGDGDGFPTGAISFFLDTGCPAGWSLFTDGVGRTIVPTAAEGAGVTVGVPMAGNAQPTHHHDLQVEINLPSVSYAGVAGEANHGVARSGAASSSTATEDAAATPPYAQLLICQKTAARGVNSVPSGVIAFFATPSCPAPWVAAAASMQGRFLLSLPSFGVHGALFGGEPLTHGEERSHTHAVTGTVATTSYGIALSSGCCADGYGGTGSHTATALAAPTSVGLPYIQLLACVPP